MYQKFYNPSQIDAMGYDADRIKRSQTACVVMRMCPALDPPAASAVSPLLLTEVLRQAPIPGSSAVNNTLRDTLEMIRKCVEVVRSMAPHFASAHGRTHGRPPPIPTTLLGAAFPYAVALKTGLTLGGQLAPVRVAPSTIQGKGVFATRDIHAHELVTTYPVDALRIEMDLHPPMRDGLSGFGHFYRDDDFNGAPVAESWDAYKMAAVTDGIDFYGNPHVHPPSACGHILNDPQGSGRAANCVECYLAGGAVIGILATENITTGSELLMEYGAKYWKNRPIVTQSSED